MGASQYKIQKMDDVEVAAAATETKYYRLPLNRGKGAPVFYFKVTTAGSPTVTITGTPILTDDPSPAHRLEIADTEYQDCAGATAVTFLQYKAQAGTAAITALAVTNGQVVMATLDMDGIPWDGLKIAITAAVADVTITPYIAID
uniref:Uncharacterized protein n=1 Tax=viral metagenome TaxID=1070528 RepID=A0A6M3XJI2_9ZZZZ